MSSALETALEMAWRLRESLYGAKRSEWPALRAFHGPGEGEKQLASVAIDLFGEHAWVTSWDEREDVRRGSESHAPTLDAVARFLEKKGLASAVVLERPKQGVPEEPRGLFGRPPEGRFHVLEGAARFLIQLQGARHPGLFLDHAPLRRWLQSHSAAFPKALNTFAYTGSLSVACGIGGAGHVTTLDLGKPVIQWAKENWQANGLAEDRARFIAGDVFEWLPRLKREGERYDCVILDPPSFSHGNKGRFSTAKDLPRLHQLAIDVLAPGGVLITSINSANVSWMKYEQDIAAAARASGARFETLARVDLPATFPTKLGQPDDRYLKGFILRRT